METVQHIDRTVGSHAGPGPVRALVLDDSRVDRRRIGRLCRDAGLDIVLDEAGSLQDFAVALEGEPYDLFLVDYRLGEGDGMIALEMLNRNPDQRNGRAIMVAGEGQIQVAIDAMKAGCRDFLLKDYMTADGLARAIGRALGDEPRGGTTAGDGGAERFAEDHAPEMRSILSAMLRHVRSLRHAGGPEAELQGVEAATARLWNFLEGLKSAEHIDRTGGTVRPRRLS
ncbi:MAG: response regulator [Paracoccaceae bacterium]|nr:response regulator [Paracoccaceae bacterium]